MDAAMPIDYASCACMTCCRISKASRTQGAKYTQCQRTAGSFALHWHIWLPSQSFAEGAAKVQLSAVSTSSSNTALPTRHVLALNALITA
jgi:hypothetical protein